MSLRLVTKSFFKQSLATIKFEGQATYMTIRWKVLWV